MPKLGDVLYSITTEEPSSFLWRLGPFYLVRRPVMGQHGIRYQLGIFLAVELETIQEQCARLLENIKLRNEIAMADAQMDTGPLANLPVTFKKPS